MPCRTPQGFLCTFVGKYSTGCPKYRCHRNDSDLEGYHTDLQYYTRPPKGKHCSLEWIDVVTNHHDFRVFVKAGKCCGRLDHTCHHYDYRLRDLLFKLCEDLGYHGSDNVIPHHQLSDQTKPVLCHPGVHFGVQTIGQETRETVEATTAPASSGLPVPTNQGAFIGDCALPALPLTARNNGPGGFRGPLAKANPVAPAVAAAAAAAATSSAVFPYAGTAQFMMTHSEFLRRSPHSLRAAYTIRDEIQVLSHRACFEDARVLRRCCFTDCGVIFASGGQALELVPRRLDFNCIHQTYADFNLPGLFHDLKQPAVGVTAAQKGSQAFGGKAGLIPTQTTVLLPQHQNRGGGGAGGGAGGGGGGGGSRAAGPTVGQKRARSEFELDTPKET